jgi:hypothetical protein
VGLGSISGEIAAKFVDREKSPNKELELSNVGKYTFQRGKSKASCPS